MPAERITPGHSVEESEDRDGVEDIEVDETEELDNDLLGTKQAPYDHCQAM